MKQTSIESFRDPRTKSILSSEIRRIEKVFEAYPKQKMTAHEVNNLSTINYYIIQKRLSVLVRKGSIKEVGIIKVNGRGRTQYQLNM